MASPLRHSRRTLNRIWVVALLLPGGLLTSGLVSDANATGALGAAGAAGALGAAAAAPQLEVVVLGSGGPGATGRASSSYLVLVKGQPRIMVDSGPGSFARLGEARLPLDELDTILLTHLHIDHAGELPGVLKARAVSAGRPISFDVYGPVGHAASPGVPAFPSTERFMALLFGADGAFAYLQDFAAPITLEVTNLPPAATAGQQPFVVRDRGGVRISAVAGHHGDAPSVIYRIDCEGRSVVFSGDIDASGLPALGAISRGADLLVFDAVVLDPPASPEVLYSLHSPPKAIGPLAESSHVKQLVLSHLSPAVDEQRAAVTVSIANYYHGAVKFAADGMRLSP